MVCRIKRNAVAILSEEVKLIKAPAKLFTSLWMTSYLAGENKTNNARAKVAVINQTA